MKTNCSWLDGRHVVFGEILKGFEVVQEIEANPTAPGDKPIHKVTIVKSGALDVDEPFHNEL